jgi:cell division protein FtsB
VKARGAVVATLVGVLLLSALYPLRQYMSQDSHVNALVRQERALDDKIADLKRHQELLMSDDEVERVAREELGMVRPGEVAFAVVPGSGRTGSKRSVPAVRVPSVSGSASGRAWYRHWWDAMVGSVRGMH